MKYRPDIDGLRAVAVVAVILFHVGHAIVPGGFLGVDIFFVISGYLITTILVREIGRREFSLWRFYERRLRRIGPALLAMMLVVSAVAVAVLLPVDLIGYARSVLATVGFVSNVYFWRDTDYFARAAGEKPLLHTWSLGIEEQFYILFPLVLYAGFRLARGTVPVLVAVLTIASLAAAVLALKIGAGLPGFYLLPTRAWELGAGALLVFGTPRPIGRAAANALAAAGAAAVAAALIVDPAALPPLMPPALFAVAGAAALIGVGQRAPTLVGRALASPVTVVIGRMSYSLYLWHWPVLVFTRYYLVRDTTAIEDAAMLAAIAGLAFVSWSFVEMPFRRRRVGTKALLGSSAASVAMLMIVAAAIFTSGGFPARLNVDAARINATVGTNYRCGLTEFFVFGASRACSVGGRLRSPQEADVVLLGNSHAQMYAPVIGAILRDHDLRGLLVPAPGCLPWTATNISTGCVVTAREDLAAVAGLAHARIVIIMFNWAELTGPLADAQGQPVPDSSVAARAAALDATIAVLRRAGKRVIVVGPLAVPGWDVASDLSRDLAFGHAVTRPLFTPYSAFIASYGPAIATLARRFDLALVRPDLVQCRRGACDYLIGGESLFADDNHLAAKGAMYFRPVFEPVIVAAARQ